MRNPLTLIFSQRTGLLANKTRNYCTEWKGNMVSLNTHMHAHAHQRYKKKKFKIENQIIAIFRVHDFTRGTSRAKKWSICCLLSKQPSIAWQLMYVGSFLILAQFLPFFSLPSLSLPLSWIVKWKPSRREFTNRRTFYTKKREFIIQLNSLIYLLYALIVILCKM